MIKRRNGFTLVEVVVASVMLALVMGAVAAMVAGTLVAAARVSAVLDSDLAVAEAEDLIADDLVFMAAVPGETSFSLGSSGGNSLLTFYSAAGAKAAWGNVATPLHAVSYAVLSSPDGARGLFRREQPLVETAGAYYDGDLLLVEDVRSFSVRVFDGAEWHEEWPSGDALRTLPVLVRLEVVFTDAGGSLRSIYVEAAPHVEDANEIRAPVDDPPAEASRERNLRKVRS